MKKHIALLMLSLFITTLGFASGQQAEESGPFVLNYWTHEDPNRTAIETRYIKEFEEANPDIKINRVTHSSSRIQELVLTAFAANQGPDIFNMSIEDEYAYIANQRVAPINPQAVGYTNEEALRDAYIKGVLEPVELEGRLYGLPLELTNWCIFLNKEVFRDAGLNPEKDYPKTWEEMVDVSQKIVIRQGDIITRRGFDFRYPYYLTGFVPMAEQLGGKLLSDDGKEAIVGEDAWIGFLRFMRQWGPNGLNLGSPTYKNARSLFNFNNNDIAMAHTGLYQIGRIKSDNPDFYAKGDFMVIPYPRFEKAVKDVAACYYGHYLMVNAQISKRRQEAAWKFIGSMLKHGEEYLEKVNIVQPTKELMNSSLYKSMPYSSVFTQDMERGHIVYFAENSARLQDMIRKAVESVMLSGVSPEQAYVTLKAEAQELINSQ